MPDAHLQAQTALCLEVATEVLHGALHAQGGVHGPARAVFMGNGGTKEGHHAIAGVLVDGALEAVYLSAHQPEAVIHDLVHHFGIEIPGQGREAGRIGEEYGDLLAFPFQGTAGAENLVGQMPGGIRCWGGNTGCRRWRLRQIVATGVTEAAPRRIHLAACRAYYFEFGTTGVTEPRPHWIRVLTLWTVHGVPPPCRRGFLHPRPRRRSIAMACIKTISHVTTASPRV